MPKILRARPGQDEQEARSVRKLAASRHGPADWLQHAKMVVRSWEGARVETIAAELPCRPLTVRRRLHRFDAEGFEGLGDRPRPGRPRRLTPADDSALIALVHTAPPGRLERERDGTLVARDEKREAHWSLSALAQAAKDAGISIKHSQIRRILLKEGVRWRGTHSWGSRATKTSPQKNGGRQPLRDPSCGLDDHLYRRTRASGPTHLSPSPRLVAGWPPHSRAVGLRARAGEDLGLWRAAGTRRERVDAVCTRAQLEELLALLAAIEADNPKGDLYLITDNLSSHTSLETRTWMEAHPRLHHVFIPTGACWPNLQEGWWRLFRHEAFAGQSFANPKEIDQARRRGESPPSNSTSALTLGLGTTTRPHADGVASFAIAFKERSIR